MCHLVPIRDFHVAADAPMAWPFGFPGEDAIGGKAVSQRWPPCSIPVHVFFAHSRVSGVLPRVMELIGAFWRFNPDNPTGRYKLNMANMYDHYLLLRLMELSSEVSSSEKVIMNGSQ